MRNIKYYIPFILVSIILIIVLFWKGCKEPEPLYSKPRTVEKIKIVKWNKQEDSTKTQVKKQDSVRVKYIVKWRELKADTVYKECQELIVTCDTLIKVDSTEIASLKHVVSISDSIIKDQKLMLHNDSLDIFCLKKQIKKHRRQKALLATGLIVVGAGAVLK